MLIPPTAMATRWNLHPTSILHVGAHEGEEITLYEEAGWGEEGITWVEVLPEKIAILAEELRKHGRERDQILPVLAWDLDGKKIEFNEASNGQSSSALPFKDHAKWYPDITIERTHVVWGYRLESLLPASASYEFINLDVQGAELHALHGLGAHVAGASAIYTEVNLVEHYAGCCLIDDVRDYLSQWGFELAEVEFVHQQWGDALWLRP